ncbi:hypothetical protein BDY19DRAFT_591136 [Irpex rosettiformis]|uniref:Uncharacterized protein n=1 Tax=Irpex rosettiformis TaxID=378272 RepID=A0ACB8UDI8_9APHY|nr:hypothetical protein BDY19DRAFT_591136 [Irpex rosettiformis]
MTSTSSTFHVFTHPDYAYAANCRPGILVPQQVYKSPAGYQQLSPIRFTMRNVPGIRLVDALPGVIQGLDSRGFSPPLSVTGNRITLRILWPGYGDWAHPNIAIQHFDARGNRYTMEELAGAIANRIQRFYQEMRCNPCTAAGWELQKFPFNDLYLVELRHVGQSSWQPVLMYSP